MRIKYKASPDDLVAFGQFYNKHSSTAKRYAVIYGIIIPAFFFVLACLYGWYEGGLASPVIGVVMSAALMLWILGGRRRRLEKILRRMVSEGSNKSLVGERELEITEAGLVGRSEYEGASYTWDIIERIGFTPDYTFIFTGATRGMAIAKSSVLEGDYEKFEEELRRKFEEKVKADGIQQKRDLSRRVITDASEIYKGDAGFGKHSGRGIASFVIAMAAGALYVSVLGLMIILAAIDPGLVQDRPAALHIFTAMIMAGVLGNIAGVVTGISGIRQKNQKKLFAVLGLVFNLIAVIGFVILMTIPRVIS